MAISQLRLRNFRGFKDSNVDLKPLTVILGPNSAGKSSFGHALAAMAHAHKYYGQGPQASLTPEDGQEEQWPIDLGRTNDLRTAGSEGPSYIGVQLSTGYLELGFGGLPDTNELLLSSISHAGTAISAIGKPISSGSLRTSKVTSDVIPGQTAAMPPSADVKLTRINQGQWREGASPVSVILNGLVLRAVESAVITPSALSTAVQAEFESLLSGLTYLRATRKRPARHYPNRTGKQQAIGYGGEWAPGVLYANKETTISYLRPPSVPQSIEDAEMMNYKWELTQSLLPDAIGEWLSTMKLAMQVDAVRSPGSDSELSLKATLEGQATRDITEIGFGLSQVVPVLVSGLLQPVGSLFVVDLPEAHLHPRPQGALADFFCSLALSGRNTIVETHSEMFFHRLRLRAAMDDQLMENIAVYFVDAPKKGQCCQPRRVGLDFSEELQWPAGFLQEGWEMEAQIKAVRTARSKKLL